MSPKERKSPLVLDMDFDEALRRFSKVDLDDLPENAKLKKKGAKKAPSKPKSKPD